jgi:hypothetical protein
MGRESLCQVTTLSPETGSGLATTKLRLEPNHYDGLTPVVSVVSTVVAGERRRGCGYRQERDKQENQDLLHFCSSNSSPMDLRRGLHSESLTQRFRALQAAWSFHNCSFWEGPDCRHQMRRCLRS